MYGRLEEFEKSKRLLFNKITEMEKNPNVVKAVPERENDDYYMPVR